MKNKTDKPRFTAYEKLVIALMAFIQFTIMVDFMVLSPLGAILMPKMQITTAQFGIVVSAYAISAGAAGLLAAGFADKFDRKKMLLFFYTGFVIGTILCGMANSYYFLLIARIITGIFGGVIGSVAFAIVTDLFKMEVRGRVMGFIQISFSASQVLGIPIGLYLANQMDWHAPFLMIAGISVLAGALIFVKLKPITAHLKGRVDKNAFHHLWHTASNKFYIRGYIATMLLATGGFMMMPFSSAFLVNNVGILNSQLSLIYFITGLFSIFAGPFIGILSDRVGKYNLFFAGTLLSAVMVIVYTHLGVTSLWMVVLISSIMWIGISSRIISSSALTSGVPNAKDRGAYMGINSSIQQISGGLASFFAGIIVYQPNETAPIQNFDTVGYVVIGSMAFTLFMMKIIEKMVAKKLHTEEV